MIALQQTAGNLLAVSLGTSAPLDALPEDEREAALPDESLPEG